MLLSGNALSVGKDLSVPPKAERHRCIQEARLRPTSMTGRKKFVGYKGDGLARQRLQKSYPYLLCNLDKAAIWTAMLFTKWPPMLFIKPWPSDPAQSCDDLPKSAIV